MTDSISPMAAKKRSGIAVLADPCPKGCTLSSEISMRLRLGNTLLKSTILIDYRHL